MIGTAQLRTAPLTTQPATMAITPATRFLSGSNTIAAPQAPQPRLMAHAPIRPRRAQVTGEALSGPAANARHCQTRQAHSDPDMTAPPRYQYEPVPTKQRPPNSTKTRPPMI